MKKQLTVLMSATFILQVFAAAAFAEGYHAIRREAREARHQEYKANRDALYGDRVGARVHARAAAREEHRVLRHEDRLY